VKVFGRWGGSIGDEDARAIEVLAAARPRAKVVAPERWTVAGVQLLDRYTSELSDVLDRDALAAADFTVVYDAMHGVGAGVLDGVLEAAGCRVARMRTERDPGFGGQPPDPIASHLTQLVRGVKRTGGACLGLATDGDADRFAVVEPGGRLLTETEACALLVDHLARTGRIERGVAVGAATGSLVARVAQSHGLAVSRWPIGFKHLSLALLDGAADVAGDESGGFAWARVGRDKDGILSAALMAELMASEVGAIGERLREFERSFGRLACARRAVPATPSVLGALEALRRAPPDQLCGDRVRDTSIEGGALRLELEDGFAYVRTSGTEPRVRLYAEAPGPGALAERLDHLEALLGKAAPAD
jgi:phosphomannomutase